MAGKKETKKFTSTYVDHDSLLTKLVQRHSGIDSAPIELDRATNTVDTATKDENTVVIECDIVGGGVVGSVQVVRIRRELGGKGVNLLDPGPDAEALPASADLVFSAVDSLGNLLVRETKLLRLEDDLLLEAKEAANLLKLLCAVDNVLELVKEPLVDLGQIVQPVNGVSLVVHGLTNGEPSAVGGVCELVVKVLAVLLGLKTEELRVDLSAGLLEGLLECTTDGHDLTDRLHGTADITLDVLELAQIPSGHLCDDVVEGRLEVGGSGLGDGVWQLRQSVSETDLRSSVGQGVTGSLRSQSRRTRETSVDFDDPVVKTVGLEAVLDVALANNTQVAHNLDRSRAEHVVLFVAECLTGRNDDTVTSVHTKRVEVLHVANSDTVISRITNDFVLGLLPALERLLNQDLGGEGERSGRQVPELLRVVGKTRSKTTERVSSTDNDGVSDLLGGHESLIDGVDSNRLGDRDINLVQSPGEQITILGSLKCLNTGSENLDTVLLKKTLPVHLNTQVQRSLATEGQEDAIRLLLLDNIFDIFGGYRQVVDLIGEHVRCLDSRNVGVDENGLDASLLESLEGLRTCIADEYADLSYASRCALSYQSNRTLQPDQC